MPSRSDWLLCLIAGVAPDHDGWIDVIRIMKGMFLFQEEIGNLPEVNYKFQPYDYGPFTPQVYRDLEFLSREGLVASYSPANKTYRATRQGREYMSAIDFPEQELNELLSLRIELDDLGFRDLLRRVYQAHPQSATRSVAKDVLG
jgi:uncharacterized protein